MMAKFRYVSLKIYLIILKKKKLSQQYTYKKLRPTHNDEIKKNGVPLNNQVVLSIYIISIYWSGWRNLDI